MPKWLERPLILALTLSLPALFYQGVSLYLDVQSLKNDSRQIHVQLRDIETNQLHTLVEGQYVMNKRLCAYLVSRGEADKECTAELYKEWLSEQGKHPQ